MKIINMFWFGIPPPQPIFRQDIIIIIIIIINGEKLNNQSGKRGCGGVIPTLNMFMIFMNRKT